MATTTTPWPALLGLLFDDPVAGRCLVAPDGTVLRANAEWLRSTGFASDEVLGEDVVALFPETRDMALAMHARARAGHHVEVPRHAQVVNGRETWWEGSIDPVPMEGGTGLLITTREVAPRRARSRDAEFEVLIEELHSGVALVDQRGEFTLYNRRFLEMFGLSPDATIENVNSQNWAAWQVLDPEGRLLPVDEHPVRKAALQRRAVRDQLVAVRLPSGGNARWMLVSAEPILTADGAISQIVCTYHEVTAQRHAEERAARREAQLRLAMDASLAIVFEWDISRDRVRRIQSAEEALPANDDVGRTLEEVASVVHPEDRDAFRANVAAALADPDGRYRSEFRVVRPDGEARWLAESGAVEFDHARKPLRLVGISIDVTERRRWVEELRAANERLRQAHERLRLHVESSPLGLVEWSADYRVVGFSPRAEAILGYSAEDVLGKRLDEIRWVPEEDWPAVEALMRDRSGAARPANVQRNRNRRKDGSIIHCEWYNSALYGARGELLSVLSFVLDVTERVRAEEALRANEERLRLALEAAQMAAWEYDPATKRVTMSENAKDVLATRSGRLHEDSDAGYALLHPDDVEKHRAIVTDAIARAGEYVSVYRQVRGGDVLWLEERGQVLTDGTGRTARVVGVTQNVTERKRAEEALRDSERKLREHAELVEHAPVLARNLDGEITMWNRGMQQLYGWTAEQVLGEISHDVLRTRFLKPLPAIMAEVVREGRWQGELVHRRRDGSELVVASVWLLHRDAEGLPSAIIEVNNDITELKRAQEALREADRRKDEFLGMLSHELRNPLAPIRNASFILGHADAASDAARRAREVIARQTEHITRLVDDLLDVTRIARGKIELRRSGVDLRDVVLRAGDDFRLLLEDKGITFRTSLPDGRVAADVDAVRITQVVGNLLHNAAKFTRQGDAVTLSLTVEGGDAVVTVRDTGAWIDPELLPNVFEPFVQGERTLARTEGGLGLGLALVKGIVELHGGTVGVASVGRGQGSEFVVRLPLRRDRARDLPNAPKSPQPSVTVRRVLVVDDNRDAADTLADLVRMLGHEAHVVYDGPSALRMAREHPPDIVLCDIGLPGMDGYQVARELRNLSASVRIIAVSGYAQPEDVRRSSEAGFDAHVAKPCDPDAIERLLA